MAKLPEKIVEPTDGHISERFFYQMLDFAARRDGIDNFGLEVAESVPVDTLGDLVEQIAAMPTLHSGLDLFCRRVCSNVISHVGFWLTRHDGNIWFCRTPPPGIDTGLKHPEQFAISFMVKLVRIFAGENWTPTTIWLRSNTRTAFIDHPDFTNSEIHIHKPYTAIALPNLVRHETDIHFDGAVPGTITGELSTRLSRTLKLYLPEASPDIKMAAELTGISDRTLKRQLAKSGLTFRELLQQVRFEEACRLLEDTEMSIIDITSELSYESSSNFSRAFNRWTGVSPSEYRKNTQRI